VILDGSEGPGITNIQTIESTTGTGAVGLLTADLAGMGSATTFDLVGPYKVGQPVSVTDIADAQTVEYSGTGLTLLTLAGAAGATHINFEMNSSDTGVFTLPELTVAAGNPPLAINSTGSASDNVIIDVSTIADNVAITGGTHLTFGSPIAATQYAFVGGTIDASADTGGVTTWLPRIGGASPPVPSPSQTFIGGSGNDLVHVLNFQGDVVDFSKGGTDIVEFHEARINGSGLLTNAPPSTEFYNTVNGWTTANDTIDITQSASISFQGALHFTNGGAVPAGGATGVLDFTSGSVEDGHLTPDNWIKIDTAVATVGDNAATGLSNAIGVGGTINVNGLPANSPFLMSYYDESNHQAVFATLNSNAGGTANIINQADANAGGHAVNVIGLVHMSQADYAALGAGNLQFV
jgi:hypothetical protein